MHVRILVLLSIAALLATATANANAANDRTITVEGTGIVTTVPNEADFTFGVSVTGPIANAALRANGQRMTKVFAALKGLGGPGREHEAFEERRAWNQHLAKAGLTCLGWPVEHGGRGLSVAHRVAFYEEYAIANAPAKINHFGEELLGPTLIAYGTPEQQQRFLPRIPYSSPERQTVSVGPHAIFFT